MYKDKNNQKLVLFILIAILIILILLVNLLKSSRNNSYFMDYDKVDEAQLFLMGKRVYDKTIYYTLDEIITKYIYSYSEDGIVFPTTDEVGADYKEYFSVLNTNYQKYLGKDGYIKLAKEFISKFIIVNDIEFAAFDTVGILKDIYLVEQNTYMCNLQSEYNNEFACIVIKLNQYNKTFEILYLN